MYVASPVSTSRNRLRPRRSSTQGTQIVKRGKSATRSRQAVASAAFRPDLPTQPPKIHVATAKHKSHWGYRSSNGPAKWSTLDEKFRLCGVGRQQSPIDIAAAAEGTSSSISFDYKGGPATVINNGHTVQVNVPRGNRLRVGDRVYRLIQFHFHTPSENTINGLHYPMETHLVHKDANGRLAVIALMVRAGRRGILDNLPQPAKTGGQVDAGSVNPSDLIPVSKEHYVFKGSLTTPPCSEGVGLVCHEAAHRGRLCNHCGSLCDPWCKQPANQSTEWAEHQTFSIKWTVPAISFDHILIKRAGCATRKWRQHYD